MIKLIKLIRNLYQDRYSSSEDFVNAMRLVASQLGNQLGKLDALREECKDRGSNFWVKQFRSELARVEGIQGYRTFEEGYLMALFDIMATLDSVCSD